MKIINIDIWEYQKTKIGSIPLNIPTEKIYLFETGIRRSICVTPNYTTYKKEIGEEEQIMSLSFLCVYLSFENKIDLITISLSDLKQSISLLSQNTQKIEHRDIIEMIYQHGFYDTTMKRTEEQFLADYNKCVNTLKSFC